MNKNMKNKNRHTTKNMDGQTDQDTIIDDRQTERRMRPVLQIDRQTKQKYRVKKTDSKINKNMDGWTDGQTVRKFNLQIYGRMNGWTTEWIIYTTE